MARVSVVEQSQGYPDVEVTVDEGLAIRNLPGGVVVRLSGADRSRLEGLFRAGLPRDLDRVSIILEGEPYKLRFELMGARNGNVGDWHIWRSVQTSVRGHQRKENLVSGSWRFEEMAEALRAVDP